MVLMAAAGLRRPTSSASMAITERLGSQAGYPQSSGPGRLTCASATSPTPAPSFGLFPQATVLLQQLPLSWRCPFCSGCRAICSGDLADPAQHWPASGRGPWQPDRPHSPGLRGGLHRRAGSTAFAGIPSTSPTALPSSGMLIIAWCMLPIRRPAPHSRMLREIVVEQGGQRLDRLRRRCVA